MFSAGITFPLDGSSCSFDVDPEIETPPAFFDDGQPNYAELDVGCGFRGFGDLFAVHGVIENVLRWTCGRGRVARVEDFVDRGASTTHVLWFTSKLDHYASAQGGRIHFILGNHVLKALYGDRENAAPRYAYAAAILATRRPTRQRSDAGALDREQEHGEAYQLAPLRSLRTAPRPR